MKKVFAACAACLLLFSVGCDRNAFQTAPVNGKVLFDGEPLADATVNFEPVGSPPDYIAGPGSFATTGGDGRFALQTVQKRRGALVGSHRVTIQTFRAERDAGTEIRILSKERLPDAYHNESILTFDVPKDGTDTADFNLSSKP